MLLSIKRQNHLFQFDALNHFQGLTHFVVGRRGGASQPPFDGMNLSQGVGDDPAAVDANRNRLLELTGGGIHVYARQNHGTTIRVVIRDVDDHEAAIQLESEPADALITNVPGVQLLIQTADCQAVMLFDPQKRVVANIHCGWRGSVANIIGMTVSRMVAEFGCQPRSLIAAIGPSLGPCCAEFINFQKEIPRHLWSYRVGTSHFNFWHISRHQLITAGLLGDHIHDSCICTRCNAHLFFSYRVAPKTGRFTALIGIDDDVANEELEA